MILSDIIKIVGGATVVVAAIGWVAESIITHWLNRDIERVKDALARINKLEADLTKSRGEAYGEIWKLTGSLNLFGPTTPVDNTELSVRLANWYFERGWVLTEKSKSRYFLVQEVLSFLRLRSISVRRPADEVLFGSNERPIKRLNIRCKKFFKIELHKDEDSHSLEELRTYVSNWKSESSTLSSEDQSESAWILLQFLLSTLRSGIVDELGSRVTVDMERPRTKWSFFKHALPKS